MRIKKLQSVMKEKCIDCVILTTNKDEEFNNNIIYYTGFKGWAIFVVKQRSSQLLVPEMEFEKGKKTGIKTIIIGKRKKESTLKKAVGKAKVIGIDKISTSLLAYENMHKDIKGRYKDMSLDLILIRKNKDKSEMEAIKKACKVGDKIFSKIVKNFKFKTEKELAIFIDLEIRKRGLVPSFPAIVASGKNSSIVHHNNEGKIGKGFLLLDFGCKVDGYCSDMSRTIYLGKPSRKEIQNYYKLFKVQQDAIKMLKPGIKCEDVDGFVRKELGEYAQFFIHSLGHGVGLDIHEQPNMSPNVKDKLEKGMVITIEPGLYFEEMYGIRIEDTILITSDGYEVLTKSKKELVKV